MNISDVEKIEVDLNQKISVLSNEILKPEEVAVDKSLDGSFISQPEVGLSWVEAAKEFLLVPPAERLKM